MTNEHTKTESLVFLRLPEVLARTKLSRSTIYRLMDEGKFPASVSLGSKTTAWVESEVHCWMLERIQERDNLNK